MTSRVAAMEWTVMAARVTQLWCRSSWLAEEEMVVGCKAKVGVYIPEVAGYGLPRVGNRMAAQ